MAKEIVWTKTAIQDRFKIYQYWADRNKSNSFSDKLEILFNEAAKLLSEFPEIGTQTDAADIRVKVVKSYKLFYLNSSRSIHILRVWDTRQDPEELSLEQ